MFYVSYIGHKGSWPRPLTAMFWNKICLAILLNTPSDNFCQIILSSDECFQRFLQALSQR